MKIAVIADVLGEDNNGTTTACMNLVRYLRSQGDEVTIVCCDKDKKGLDGYAIVGTHNFGPIINKIIEKNNVVLAKPDNKIIKDAVKDVDLVHIMMPFALGNASVKIAKEMGKPVTAGFHVQAENFTAHIGMKNFSLANNLAYHRFFRTLYRHCDAIHYPTQFIRDIFENNVHKKTNGYVISNGVHNRFVQKESKKPENLKDKFVILFTGRYSEEKSHRILVKAVGRSKYKDKIQLIFAGQGPRRGEIIRCAKREKIAMPILKFFSKDDLVDVINYSDLYCHPAEVEIEAIACLEAISCGLVPVISNSKKCATKAFAIDENNLFCCNDFNDLAKKIDYWIEHPQEKKKRSEEYCGYAKEFNQKECMRQMRTMMIEACKNNK